MSMRARLALGSAIGLALVATAVIALPGAIGSRGDVPVYVVEPGPFSHRVDAEGVLVAERATALTTPRTAQGSMRIAWLAPDGSRVSEGEVVIRFDATEMEKELYEGRTARDKALGRSSQKSIEQETSIENLGRDARMADLQLEHARDFQTTDESIYSRREIVESQIDETLALRRKSHAEASRELRGEIGEIELDLLSLEQQKAQITIDKAESGLRELEVRAPHAGIFVLRADWGEPASIGSITWPGQTVAEIPQLDEMKARVFVLEADAGGVEAGLSAEVRLDAHPTETVAASVRRVASVPSRKTRWSPVQYFEVEIEFPETDPERMKPGQRLRASLLIQDLDNVMAVPREAIFRTQTGEPYVFRRAGSEWREVEVTLGPAALGRVVIESGVEAGDVVALEHPNRAPEAGSVPAEEAGPSLGPTGGVR